MQSLNRFNMAPLKGQMDLQYNPNVVACQVGSAQATPLLPAMPVTVVDNLNGVPSVIEATSDAADIFGFVVLNIKKTEFAAYASVEIAAFQGNVMYMEASAAIVRGADVAIVPTGDKVVTAVAGDRVIGKAYDKASNDGDLIRVYINLPGAIVPTP